MRRLIAVVLCFLISVGAVKAASPWNYSTLSSTSRVKLFGGNILQCPDWKASCTGGYSYGAMWSDWANVYPKWIKKQMQDWAKRGGNTVRVFLPNDYIITGALTQGGVEANLTTLVSDARSLGLTLGIVAMAVPSYSSVGNPSAAAIWAPMASEITNVLAANAGTIAYIEPANQETDINNTTDIAKTDAVLGLMKGSGTPIPVMVSSFGCTFTAYTAANYDIAGCHHYVATNGITYDNARDLARTGLSATQNKPMLMEESGVVGQTPCPTFQQTADWHEYVLQAMFGHPNIMGYLPWGGYGASGDGCFQTLQSPLPYNPNGFDANAVWTDTVASQILYQWGPLNRNLTYALSLHGNQAITTSSATLNVNAATAASAGSITDINFGTTLFQATPITVSGTFSLTGTDSYTLSLFASCFSGGCASTTIGSVTVTGPVTNRAFNLHGVIPTSGTWVPEIHIIAVASTGTMTALDATYSLGLAPPAAVPANTNYDLHAPFGVGANDNAPALKLVAGEHRR